MIDTLVLSSGGVRGVAFVGAVAELEHLGVIDLAQIRLFVGCSVGAIISCFLALGMTGRELVDEATNLNIADLMSVNLLTFVYEWGFDDQSRFRAYVASHVERRLGSPGATFADLRRSRGVGLRVCATNLTLCEARYFDDTTAPDMPIVDAVAMSSAIPPLFRPIKYQEALWIDGAFLDSYPVGNTDPARTLGVRLQWSVACNLASVGDFYSRLVFVALNYAGRTQVCSEHTTIDVDIGNVSTTNVDIGDDVRRQLICDGRDAVGRFVARGGGATTAVSAAANELAPADAAV